MRGNARNLIPFSQRSHEEMVEIGKLGAIKSAESRRKKREMKEWINIIGEMNIHDDISGCDAPADAVIIYRLY